MAEHILLEKITEHEYKMLEQYRDWYAWSDEKASNCKTLPITEILVEWAKSKKDLYALFGNELMIHKDFEFHKPERTMREEIYKIMEKTLNDESKDERHSWKFIEAYREWCATAYPIHSRCYWEEPLTPQQIEENNNNTPIHQGLSRLISASTLVKNEYAHDNFTLILPNGKPYTVREGCKPIRALAKIAAAFNIPHFEEFRICHSLVHNQKKIKGELHLSIHPLDYWTMSDNDCGWDSCMNWQTYGGYRQGTVEMMNSPCVIVAYLSASEKMPIGQVGEWTNKKWRQLFIVDKNIILGIKAYPYRNDDLTRSAMIWIKELAEQNLGWKYLSAEPEHWTSDTKFSNPFYADSDPFTIEFSSNHMYTDVGSLDSHYIYIGAELHSKILPASYERYTDKLRCYLFNYSGASQCVSCGTLDPEIDDESFLCCVNCETSLKCCNCGDRLYRDDAYCLHGQYLCETCWIEETKECELCNDNDFHDNFTSIHILPKLEDEDILEMVKKEIGDRPHWDEENEYEPACISKEIEMCHNCYTHFERNYLKQGCKMFYYYTRYGCYYGCYLEDLTQIGIEALFSYDFIDDYDAGMSKKDLIKKYFLDDTAWVKIRPKEF